MITVPGAVQYILPDKYNENILIILFFEADEDKNPMNYFAFRFVMPNFVGNVEKEDENAIFNPVVHGIG